MAKKFALIGAAGYIAPRHLKAIKDVGGELVAAVDKHDSLGILDSFFPDADVFTEIERFERHLEKLHRRGEPIDYLSICSPNYLHDSHIRLGLRCGANVICEKPLVINQDNIQTIMEMERETDKKVYPILQLRLHPEILKLKREIELSFEDKHEVKLVYHTPRGKWYDVSWKGDEMKSGGLATNIGIHLFDMLLWIFGDYINFSMDDWYENEMSGHLALHSANVKFELSINPNNKTTRLMSVDGRKINFTDGFTDLHTEVYKKILEDKWYSASDTIPSLDLVTRIRSYQY